MSFEIKSSLKWNGTGAMKDFDRANIRALTEAAILVEGKAVEKVNVKTGALKQSITRVVDKLKAFVGTPLEYAPYIEFGTRFHKPYPFLRPAFFTSVKKINNIFKKLYKAVKYVK